MTKDKIGKVIVKTIITIHKTLVSGFYKMVYEVVLAQKLKKHVTNTERHISVSIEYDRMALE